MAEKKKIYTNEECSREFYFSFMAASTFSQIDCGACGRTHFVINGEFNEDEEDAVIYEKLLQDAEKDPDSFIASPDDGIAWANIFGIQTVFYCPCNFAGFIENGIIHHESQIVDFLEKVIQENQKDADQRSENFKRLKKEA